MTKTFYKIRIHAVNNRSNSYVDGVYKLDLGDMLDPTKSYRIAVESFVNKSYYVNPYLIVCPSFSQGNTYSTLQDGSDFVLCAVNGAGYVETINQCTLGCKLQDVSFLRTKQIRIKFTDLDGVPLSPTVFGAAASFLLTLVVWESE